MLIFFFFRLSFCSSLWYLCWFPRLTKWERSSSSQSSCPWCLSPSFWVTRTGRKTILPSLLSQLLALPLEECCLTLRGKKMDIFCNWSVCLFFHRLLILSGNFLSIFPGSPPTQEASHSLADCCRTSCPAPFVTCCGIYRKMCIEPGWMKRMWETRGVQLLCPGKKGKKQKNAKHPFIY